MPGCAKGRKCLCWEENLKYSFRLSDPNALLSYSHCVFIYLMFAGIKTKEKRKEVCRSIIMESPVKSVVAIFPSQVEGLFILLNSLLIWVLQISL